MNSPHPYAAAADHLTAATANLQEARNAHARAYQGKGSDSTTAESIRGTIRALQRYLDETSQPHSTPEEEQAETELEQAQRNYETAKADAHRAIKARAAAEVECDRAHNASAAADRTARQASANIAETEKRRIHTAHQLNYAEHALEAAKKTARATAQ